MGIGPLTRINKRPHRRAGRHHACLSAQQGLTNDQIMQIEPNQTHLRDPHPGHDRRKGDGLGIDAQGDHRRPASNSLGNAWRLGISDQPVRKQEINVKGSLRSWLRKRLSALRKNPKPTLDHYGSGIACQNF